MNTTIQSLIPLLLVAGLCIPFGIAATPADLGAPIALGTEEGIGPIALPVLRNIPQGTANVYGSERPDLFVYGDAGPHTGLYLFPWYRDDSDGFPVFGSPQKIEAPERGNIRVHQFGNGKIYGVWLKDKALFYAEFDRDTLSFLDAQSISLPGLPENIGNSVTIFETGTSSEVVFDVSDGASYITSKIKPREEGYYPFDSAGSWHGDIPYRHLWAAPLSGVIGNNNPSDITAGKPHQVSSKKNDILFNTYQLTPVQFRPGKSKDLIAGSRFGNMYYYENLSQDGLQLAPKRAIAGRDGNALRHPTISPGPVAYPNLKNGLSDLIAGNEGALYYYRFSGDFTKEGVPVFDNPVCVKQTHADLYTGTLPVLNVVDWDGDNVLDLVAGNSEGFINFFKNTGSNAEPSFMDGTRLQAAGRDICIQAGYGGSIQGPLEARWGYVCPTAIDWDHDGDLDIVQSDVTGNYSVFINSGTKQKPLLDKNQPIYCDGLHLHGMWRVQPAVGDMDNHMAMIMVDGEDRFHLYWRIDDTNVEDGGQLQLEDGSPITGSYQPGGGTGRCKLHLTDWDEDGKMDLLIGTSRSNGIPNRKTGYPRPALGERPLVVVLFMKNVGSNSKPLFRHPAPLRYNGALVQPGGAHACTAAAAHLGKGGKLNLICGNETGRIFICERDKITWE